MRRELSRRDTVRIGTVGLGVSLAGCGSALDIGGEEVTGPETDGSDRSSSFTYKRDGEKLLKLALYHPLQDRNHGYEMEFRTMVWHREGTDLESLKYTFRPPYKMNHLPRFYWTAPRPNWSETDFHETEDGRGVVFEVPDLEKTW